MKKNTSADKTTSAAAPVAPAAHETPTEMPAEKPAKGKRTSKQKPAEKSKATAQVERDAWNARADSRMAKINAGVIAAGKAGVTTAEVAAKSKESTSLVSAQLSWHVTKKNCTRKQETVEGKKVNRWFPKL